MHQRQPTGGGQTAVVQLRLLHPAPHPVHHEGLVPLAVVEEQVPVGARLLQGPPPDQTEVLLFKFSLGHGGGEGRGGAFGPGHGHHAAHAPVQPVDREEAAARLAAQGLEEIVPGTGLGQQARRLQAHQEAPLLV